MSGDEELNASTHTHDMPQIDVPKASDTDINQRFIPMHNQLAIRLNNRKASWVTN